MKPEEEKKLALGKETIQDLNNVLDRDEQKRLKGGAHFELLGTTQIPIYC